MSGAEASSSGTAVVIGLGLMGGSLARDLAGLGWTVHGHDTDPDTLEAAAELSAIEPAPDNASLDAALADADLVVIAVPVLNAPGVIRRVAERMSDAVVATDLGSTKRTAVEAAEAAGLGPRFVGSHPLAGHHTSGWSASRTGLFRDATVWLCPTADTAPGVLPALESLWRSLNARPVVTDPAAHDHLVAWASHLPQVAASALAVALGIGGIARADLGPGGRDTTRLAAGDPSLWTEILTDNADEVAPALDTFIDELVRMRRALHAADDASVRALLEAGRAL